MEPTEPSPRLVAAWQDARTTIAASVRDVAQALLLDALQDVTQIPDDNLAPPSPAEPSHVVGDASATAPQDAEHGNPGAAADAPPTGIASVAADDVLAELESVRVTFPEIYDELKDLAVTHRKNLNPTTIRTDPAWRHLVAGHLAARLEDLRQP